MTLGFRVNRDREGSLGFPDFLVPKDLEVPRETGVIQEIRECLALVTKERWDHVVCRDYQVLQELETRDRLVKGDHPEKQESVVCREVLDLLDPQVTANFVMPWHSRPTDNQAKRADLIRAFPIDPHEKEIITKLFKIPTERNGTTNGPPTIYDQLKSSLNFSLIMFSSLPSSLFFNVETNRLWFGLLLLRSYN